MPLSGLTQRRFPFASSFSQGFFFVTGFFLATTTLALFMKWLNINVHLNYFGSTCVRVKNIFFDPVESHATEQNMERYQESSPVLGKAGHTQSS